MTRRAPRRPLGALWMLLPAACAAVGAALLLQRQGGTRDVVPPPVADPDAPVAALGGSLAGRGGAVLLARLSPLHPDPARQAFETEALAARLGLGAGEPWRLSLRCEGPDPAAEPEPGRPPAGPFSLGALEVTDERGTALRPIPAQPVPERAGGAADPLRSLLAPPGGALGPGEEVDWVLWGRAPGPGARLSGDCLAGPWTGDGGDAGLELEPRTVRQSELELPVARLDRVAPGSSEPGPGKTAPSGTSR